jgi:hypothetical protein
MVKERLWIPTMIGQNVAAMRALWNKTKSKARNYLGQGEWWVYRQAPSVHAFTAGVLVSVAVNLLTSLAVAERVSWPIVLSAFFFFLSSLGFIGVSFRLEQVRDRTSRPGVDDLDHKEREIQQARIYLRLSLAVSLLPLGPAVGLLVHSVLGN